MLESIELNNFKCLKGAHSYEFDSGIYSIKGIKDGDTSVSNRLGKTSFLEAIRFALFKGPVSNLVTKGESEMSVSISLNGTELKAGTFGTQVNGESVLVSDLKATSEVLLGMDYQMFACTVGAFSESLLGFLSLKPKEQKEFLLSNFCDSNVDWESVRETIQEKVCYYMEKKKEIEANINRISGFLKEIDVDFYTQKLDNLKYELKTKEQEYKLSKSSSEIMLQEYKDCLMQKTHLTTKINQITEAKRSIQSLKDVIKFMTNRIDETENALKYYLTVPGYDYQIKSADATISKLTVLCEEISSSLQVYESTGGLCPILKKECPYGDGLKEFCDTEKATLLEYNDTLTKLSESKEEAMKKRQEASTLNSYLHENKTRKFNAEAEVRELESETQNLTDLVTELEEVQSKIQFYESGLNVNYIETLLNSINTLQANINKVEGLLLDVELKTAEKYAYDLQLSEVLETYNEYMVAAKIVSPKGLPHLLLTEILTMLEVLANRYLSFVDMSIIITGYSELKSMEEYCSIDGTKFSKADTSCKVCGAERGHKLDESISIISKDTGVEWWEESSGGRSLIALAIRLALFKMAKAKKAGADFLILDEVFTNLDTKNKQKTMQMLQYAMKDLELKQIFLVSHDELKDCTDHEIFIAHENNEVTIK